MAAKRWDADHLKKMTDAARLVSAAFTLSPRARKEVIRNNRKFPINQLCNWSHNVVTQHCSVPTPSKLLRSLKTRPEPLLEWAKVGTYGYGSFREVYGRCNGEWRNKQQAQQPSPLLWSPTFICSSGKLIQGQTNTNTDQAVIQKERDSDQTSKVYSKYQWNDDQQNPRW